MTSLPQNDDTVVEETPILDVHDLESGSGSESEPEVVVKKAPKAKSGKRKRNNKEEEEYEIYAKTIKERAPIWEHYDPVRMKNCPNTRRALCRVVLPSDTWTSTCQRTNYVVVTTYFIDDDWNMHKRIINFRPIESHRADDISGDLLKCIVGWGIKNVMAMTVDNAPSNDKAIGYLIKKLPNARLYDDGKHFHVRCMAHVLNLIVQEGLKVKNYHVECLSNAVRYIRQSTQRIKKFKACMKESGLESNRFLCGECPTRWNSKHDMLKIAIELRDVFFKYELVDDGYYRDLNRVPEHSDFGACKDIVEFLEKI
ncbi:zinc finger BED domain-containing protein RICESLEEPER 2 [Tanacetum coccineum]